MFGGFSPVWVIHEQIMATIKGGNSLQEMLVSDQWRKAQFYTRVSTTTDRGCGTGNRA